MKSSLLYTPSQVLSSAHQLFPLVKKKKKTGSLSLCWSSTQNSGTKYPRWGCTSANAMTGENRRKAGRRDGAAKKALWWLCDVV